MTDVRMCPNCSSPNWIEVTMYGQPSYSCKGCNGWGPLDKVTTVRSLRLNKVNLSIKTSMASKTVIKTDPNPHIEL